MRSIARADRPAADRALPWMVGLALVLLVWGPVLGRGYVLAHDMVFVPSPDLNARSLGLDGGVPRAVPMDFLVALVAVVVPAWVVQQVALVGTLLAGTVGAWRASPARTLPGALAAAVLYTWNPYVAERLGMGHWSLLLGYAVLPWLYLACRRLARGEGGPARVVVLAGVAAFATPTSGVLEAVTVVCALLVLGGPLRPRLLAVAGSVVVNLPWVVAGLVSSAHLSASDAGTAFAATSDTPLGGALSVVTFGGIWNSQVWPAARGAAAGPLLTLLLVTVAVGGAVVLARRSPRELVALAVPGVLGLGLVLLSLTGPGDDLIGWWIRHVPALGLLRDTQKWLAWWLLLVVWCLGPGVDWLWGLPGRTSGWRVTGAYAAAYVCLVALPGLAWGVAGQLGAAWWPQEYAAARDALDEAPPGAVLVLPFHAVRAWTWNDDRPVLDPWQRMVDRRVVINDALELTHRTVPGEDPLARAVTRLGPSAPAPDALRAIGIRYVVLDRTTAPRTPDVASLHGARLLHDGPLLKVWDLGSVTAPPATVGGAGWLLALDALVGAGWLGLTCRESLAGLGRLLRYGRVRGRNTD